MKCKESSVSSAVPSDSTWDSGSPYRTIAQSLRWRGNLRPWQFWKKKCGQVPWIAALFEWMSAQLTTPLCADTLTGLLEDSPASPALPQAKDFAFTMSGGCGRSASEPFAILEPGGDISRTLPGSYLPGMEPPSEPYSGSWPKSGSMRSGRVYQWKRAEGAKNAKESSSWPTPEVPNGGRAMKVEDVISKGATDGGKRQVPLAQVASLWANPPSGCNSSSTNEALNLWTNLLSKATSTNEQPTPCETWATPSASIANDGEDPLTWLARAEELKAKHVNGNGAGMPLTVQASLWLTPHGFANTDASGHEAGAAGEFAKQQVNRWATSPQVQASGRRSIWKAVLPLNAKEYESLLTQLQANGVAYLPLTPNSHRPRLNPLFVEWLQGMPRGWITGPAGSINFEDLEIWLCLSRRLCVLLSCGRDCRTKAQ